MPYIGSQPSQVAFLTDSFNGNGSTTAFTMSVAPANSASILIAISGVTQAPSVYSVVGTTLTFSTAPPSGTANISVRYLGIPASGVVTTAYRTLTEFTATASQTTFTPPSYTVGFLNVYRNGVMLGSADYTATNGTTVVLAVGALVGDTVTTESFYVSSVLNAIPATAGAVNSSYIASGVNINAGTLTTSVDANIHGLTVGLGANSVANNTAVGRNALVNSSLSGGFNTGIGSHALTAITTGQFNTGIGQGSGQSTTIGVYNTCVGYAAGGPNATTVEGATYIGAAMNASSTTANYEIAIGFNLTGKGSATFYAGTNGGGSYNGANTTTWATTSDQRLKKNIVDNNTGLDAINAIQVRNFEYRLPEEVTELPKHSVIDVKGVQLGVIAQELQLVLPDCVKEESTGVLSVNSDNLIWYLVNSIQELKAELDALKLKVGA